MEAAGGSKDEGARGVEAGAAKTRWHGAGDGDAPVSGLAGSSSKAAELGRRSGMAAEQEARSEATAARRRSGMPKCWRKAEVKGHI